MSLHNDLQRLLLYYTKAKTYYAFFLLSKQNVKMSLAPYFIRQSKRRLLRKVIFPPRDEFLRNIRELPWERRHALMDVYESYRVLYRSCKNYEKERYGIILSYDDSVNKHGFPNGLYTLYYGDGVVSERYSFVNGVLEGFYKTFWHNGNIMRMMRCRNGMRHGIEEYFDVKGNLDVTLLWDNGRCISDTEWDYYDLVDMELYNDEGEEEESFHGEFVDEESYYGEGEEEESYHE